LHYDGAADIVRVEYKPGSFLSCHRGTYISNI